jgi:Ca2+-dependent lipid-binding protein
VIFVGATIDQAKKWDSTPFFTKPDPYVEVSVGQQTGKTTNQDETYDPQWDELVFTTTANALLTWGMDLKVFDDDWPTGDELMGSCTVTVTESLLQSGIGSTNCGADVTSLDYKLQAQ